MKTNSKTASRITLLNGERLQAQGLIFAVGANGDVEIMDHSEPMQLFADDAIRQLEQMFGVSKMEDMLGDVAQTIDAEIFGQKMRNAFEDRKR